MSKTTAATVSAVALAALLAGAAAHAETMSAKPATEKCYGVAKAGDLPPACPSIIVRAQGVDS